MGDIGIIASLTFFAWFCYLLFTLSPNISFDWDIFWALPAIGISLWIFEIIVYYLPVSKYGNKKQAKKEALIDG